MVKEHNDYRFALYAFMAAYGNCDIPGALMTLAYKPEVPRGVSEHDACELAMFQAWIRGAKVIGLKIEPKRAKAGTS
jgi:hypothetical protein